MKNPVLIAGLALFATLMMSSAAETKVVKAPASPGRLKTAFAALTSCRGFVRADEQYLMAGGTAGIQLVSLTDAATVLTAPLTLPTTSSIIDVARSGDRVFALATDHLEEWSLARRSRIANYPTILTDAPLKYKQQPTALLLHGDDLFIAHGRIGYSVFNITKRQLVDARPILTDQAPLESMAVGIADIGHDQALLAIDNFSAVENGKPALRGFLVLDLRTHEVTREIDGIDPGAESITALGDRVLVGFNPPVWSFSVENILQGQSAPLQRVWNFPQGGHFTGKTWMDAETYYGCFIQSGQHGQPAPLAIDRAQYHLN